eukprot:jgi/Chlat1/4927/Chrsp31S04844
MLPLPGPSEDGTPLSFSRLDYQVEDIRCSAEAKHAHWHDKKDSPCKPHASQTGSYTLSSTQPLKVLQEVNSTQQKMAIRHKPTMAIYR